MSGKDGKYITEKDKGVSGYRGTRQWESKIRVSKGWTS